jgi:hypothetical protein
LTVEVAEPAQRGEVGTFGVEHRCHRLLRIRLVCTL